jgi:hypothetical protein
MKRILGLAIITFLGFKASAQDTQTDNHQITVVIPNIALLDLESSVAKNFTSTFVQPTPLEAGQKITAPTSNSDVWLNYSSILPSTVVLSRRVDVKLNALIAGVDISVVAGASSTGFGTKGTPTSAVTLTTTNQPLINSIGSAYTVSGASNGHNLTYSFAAADANFANLRAASTAVTVTYTLVDN